MMFYVEKTIQGIVIIWYDYGIYVHLNASIQVVNSIRIVVMKTILLVYWGLRAFKSAKVVVYSTILYR